MDSDCSHSDDIESDEEDSCEETGKNADFLNAEQLAEICAFNFEENTHDEEENAASTNPNTKKSKKKILPYDLQVLMFLDYIDEKFSLVALRPQFQNVTPSFADEVPFLVDGDSLMITVMSDKNWSNQLGGSSLHLVYLFERYLNIFVQQGGTFHIVFFQNWSNVWNTNWNILLLRSVLINHLYKNLPQYPVHLFDNCFDKDFANLVSFLRPGFILTNMDAYENCSELFKVKKQLLKHIMNINLLSWLKMDLPCIDTNFIQVDVSVVRGYYLESNSSVKGVINKHLDKFTYFINNLPKIEFCMKIPPLKIPGNFDIRRATFLTAAYMFYKRTNDESMVKIFFLTCALMEFFELKFRGCHKFEASPPELDKILDEWFKCMFFALNVNKEEDYDPLVVCDLWQGMLFGHACRLVLNPVNNCEELGEGIGPIYEILVQEFNKFGYSISMYPLVLSNSNIEFEDQDFINEPHTDPMPLSQVQNKLTLLFCENILNNIIWANPPKKLIKKEYSEEHHYHNMKVITDEHDRTKDTIGIFPSTDWERKRFRRNRDLYAKYMTLYGASIEGRSLTTCAIVRNSKNSKIKEKKEGKKAKQIKEANAKVRLEEQGKKYKEQFDKLKEQSKKYDVDLEKLLNSINLLLANKNLYQGSYKTDTLFLKLKTLRSLLKHKTNTNENKKLIFLTVREILTSNRELSTKQKIELSKSLSDINCSEIAKRNDLPIESEPSSENNSWIYLQLLDLGPELIRETGGKADPRVSGFIPDPWQIKLFDIVDKRQCALIVAPTSSGKTYASYYCMEKVLKEGTEGVVVYVAPTKALVNQVAATVYARFKDTDMPDGKSVYGVFTRDYRMYALNSQILVTVPQCLEILLLSPRRYSWVNRLRYVIFDEIHCIQGDLGGSSFERCLLLIRCPFLALSATIRNPEGLQKWLQTAENFKKSRDVLDGFQREELSYEVKLVIHSERHSDLTKYTYGNGQLHHLHPYADLEKTVVRKHKGIPSHMSLSPAETLQLYDTMVKVFPKCENLVQLSPAAFFSSRPKDGFISRNLVQEYASKLSKVLLDWFDNHEKYFVDTVRILRTAELDDIGTGRCYILENIPNFILHLKQKNMLPAIVFSYSRHLVKYMTIVMTEYFEDNKRSDASKIIAANKTKENACVVKTVKDHLETKKYKMKALQSYSGNANENLNNISANMNYVDKKNLPRKPKYMSWDAPLNLINEDADQSVQGIGVIDSEDIVFIEQRLRRASVTPNHLIAKSIRNGLCMHHGGLNNKVRGAVEMLYRKKFLNVVFATGTLALGIHMPCKTTVIVGDSAYLNSLEYHQLSGRAGRRGYDNAGNVIFFGLNPRKQHSLMTAKLPILKGNFPVTVSLILRTLLLISDVTDRGKTSELVTNVTISRCLAMFENCLCYMDKPDLKIITKHFFSFTVQLLQIQDFVNIQGEPLKWCGLATHLHYHEPGNLAFVYLLRTGVIREICKKTKNEEDICYTLLVILSYLFTNYPLNATSKREFRNSKVVLDPMPGKVYKALKIYNEQVRFVFKQYFANVANYFKDDDNILPLSSVKIVGQNCTRNNPKENLQTKFLNLCPPKLVCSSFAALSGNNDDNAYTEDTLISNLKQRMSTDVKVIPLINLEKELNGYALDFYRHGILSSIILDNGIKEGYEYTLLTDFLLVLKTIRVSLEEMEVKDQNDIVYKYFLLLEQKYQDIHNKAFGIIHL